MFANQSSIKLVVALMLALLVVVGPGSVSSAAKLSKCNPRLPRCYDPGNVVRPGAPAWDRFSTDESTFVPTSQLGKSRCSPVGAQRTHSGPIGKLWSMYMTIRVCWNGRVITSLSNWQVWGKDRIGWPGSWTYSVDFGISSQSPGTVGVRSTEVFAQMWFKVCLIAKPVCAPTKHPWIRFRLTGAGAAVCESDAGTIANCKGRTYKR